MKYRLYFVYVATKIGQTVNDSEFVKCYAFISRNKNDREKYAKHKGSENFVKSIYYVFGVLKLVFRTQFFEYKCIPKIPSTVVRN